MKKLFLLLVIFIQISFSQEEEKKLEIELETLDGETELLTTYLKEGPVYINFWALWCEPCKSEIKVLQQIHQKYNEYGFNVLAINHDTQKSLAKVKSFVATQNFSFPIFIDPNGEVFEQLNGKNIPYSLLIDRDGTIVKTRTGYFHGDEKDIEKDILPLLKKSETKKEIEKE